MTLLAFIFGFGVDLGLILVLMLLAVVVCAGAWLTRIQERYFRKLALEEAYQQIREQAVRDARARNQKPAPRSNDADRWMLRRREW